MSAFAASLPKLRPYGSAVAPVWPPPPRGPLPPHNPGTWETADPNVAETFHPVFTTLPQEPPSQPDNRFYRGDAWGVTVPGLPFVDGGQGGASQSRVLTYFLGRYARVAAKWEDVILEAHLARGYTHFHLSPQDEIHAGMSEDEFVAMAVRVKQAGFFVTHWLRSKYYSDPNDFAPGRRMGEKLLAAGAADQLCPAGEMDIWLQPSQARAIIDYDAAWIEGQTRTMLHFSPHYISWQEDKTHPNTFWNPNVGKVDGVWYQCEPRWTVGMMSARIQDALERLRAGGMWGLTQSFDVVAWETIATQQYINGHTAHGRLADEDEGRLIGYETCCTAGPQRVWGYGNGGGRPIGAAL